MAEKMKFDFCGSVCYNKEYRAVAIFWCRHEQDTGLATKGESLTALKKILI